MIVCLHLYLGLKAAFEFKFEVILENGDGVIAFSRIGSCSTWLSFQFPFLSVRPNDIGVFQNLLSAAPPFRDIFLPQHVTLGKLFSGQFSLLCEPGQRIDPIQLFIFHVFVSLRTNCGCVTSQNCRNQRTAALRIP